jgi:Helicase conserved C-terminal domain
MPNKQIWRSFEEARKFIRSLNLGSVEDWVKFANSPARPLDIPKNPSKTYLGKGWTNWPDILGNGEKPVRYEKWPYTRARDFMHKAGLTSSTQWPEFSKSERRPPEIPANVSQYYKDCGWVSWPDFLGFESVTFRAATGLSFAEARDVVRKENLKSLKDWEEYCRSGRRPDNIPSCPHNSYADSGWDGYPDFCGYEANRYDAVRGARLSFKQVREFTRTLNLKCSKEWHAYSVSGDRPANIPSAPYEAYEAEWNGWGDFLGYEERRNMSEELIEFFKEMLPHREALDESIWYKLLEESGLAAVAQQKLRCTSMHATILALRTDPAILERLEEARDEAPAATANANTDANEELSDIEDRTPDYTVPLTVESVRAIDDLPESTPPSVVKWVMSKMLANLRTEYLQNGEGAVRAVIEAYPQGKHFAELSATLTKELEQLHALNVPEWRLEIDGVKKEPTPMQLYTSVRVRDAKVWGNWSGTGSGKTASAGLAAFAVDSQLTLVIVNNSNVGQWKTKLEESFHNTNVVFDVKDVCKGRGSFLILNYDKFSICGARKLVRELAALKPDFIVLDEVSLVKQRGGVAKSKRRARIISLRRQLSKARVLVMSASPTINDLNEPVSILELALNKPDLNVHTRPTIHNAMDVYHLLCKYGLRYKPDSAHIIDRIEVPVGGNDLREKLRECGSDILLIEQTLMPAKLEAIRKDIKAGVVIYTQYTSEIVPMIQAFVERLGFTTAQFTGNESSAAREEIKNDFIQGTVQVLIGSSAMMMGVDGLQTRSNRIVVLSPPWTSEAMEQVEGRVIRPGSAFHSVEVITPRVILQVGANEWSWDNDRYRRIESKRDLASCANDGRVPSMVHMSENKFARLQMQTLADFEQQAKTEISQETTA